MGSFYGSSGITPDPVRARLVERRDVLAALAAEADQAVRDHDRASERASDGLAHTCTLAGPGDCVRCAGDRRDAYQARVRELREEKRRVVGR